MKALRLSVIVPTLNEGGTIAATLDRLAFERVHEVVVVDGGSTDATQTIAKAKAARPIDSKVPIDQKVPLDPKVLEQRGGLAAQLNRGAEAATGDVLVFHYADLRLPPDGFAAIEKVLRESEVVGGAFRFGLDSRRLVYRIVEFGTNLRNRLGFGPFGDQGIFARREVFLRIGGYRKDEAMEDFDLVRRLKRAGRFVMLPAAAVSSVRRWEADGILRTAVAHALASISYLVGRSRGARRLKEWLQTRR